MFGALVDLTAAMVKSPQITETTSGNDNLCDP
jgi:hypothetical protein